MSDSTPPKPKPGSLRDRIAAFEQKPASSPAPPAPRPKPGGLSQWKPRAPSPPHSPQPVNRNDHSMSATDAKESITKGGSLKERMAALQGLGAFGGGPATSPPSKPSEKPKWKPPPQVTMAPPVTGDDGEDVSTSEVADTSSIPAVSPLKTPDEEIMAVLSKSPPPVSEEASVIVSDVPGEREEEADPEEEERQRRATIAARMARLGGTRVGMGPPIFGPKPEVKPKPVALAAEKAKEELPIADIPVGEPVLKTESDADHGQVETETADNAASSPTFVVSPQLQSASPEYISQQASPATSPNIPPRAMPLLQGPRRAAPPRKKVTPKSTLSTETEVAPESLGDTSGVTSEGLPLPIPVLSHVETEVVAADPITDTSSSEPASGRPTEEPLDGSAPIIHIPEEEKSEPSPPTQLPSDPSDLRPGSPEESQVDSRTVHDFPLQDVPIELDVPSELQVPREESELEEATAYEPNKDGVAVTEEEEEDETTRGQHIAERVSKTGEFNPSGGQYDTSPLDEPTTLHAERKLSVDTIPTGTGDSTHENQSPQLGASLASYSVSSQGGSANAVNDEDGGDNESDPHAQALLQHAVEHELLKTPEGGIDYDDEGARVAHEVENVAEPGQPPEDRYDEAEGPATAEATSSPPSPIHSRSATGEPEATQVGVDLIPTPSVEDDSDSEMAPPRVTRPLPPAPAPPVPASGVSTESAIAHTRAPIVPAVLKRASVPPPTRAVPAPDNPPLFAPGSSPQHTPSVKRASVPPPSREIPVPFQESPDAASSWRQSPTQRTSISTPTRVVRSPSVPRSESLIPPPPPPPIFGGIDHGRVLTREPDVIPQVQDDPISLPPALTPKPSIPPLTPEGRKGVESRRSTDSRHSREERRSSGSGQYGVPPVPGPLKKRAPASLVPEQGVLHEDIGDPTDPRPHTPSKPPVPHTPPPTTAEPLSSVPPTSAPSLQSVNEAEDDDGLKRRQTIAERMAKLGGIKFGAPPPITRAQPSTSAIGSVQSSGQSVPEEPGEPSEETEAEDEQARRQRIAAKIAGMGGMRFGMLPIQPGMVVGSPPPPPPVSTRREEEATPREPPRTIPPPPEPVALQSESDYEYEHPSSSDDGVHVEAEESEIEEVYHEDLEDEYGVQEVEDEDEEPLPPPPPPPRSTRPPIPSARPPPVPPAGRRPSTDQVPSTPPPRTGSVDTLTSIPRPPVRQATSDFVMVEPEDAQLVPARRGPPPRSAPPAPELELASTGQWELPSIPSGSLDFGDSGATSDLSASRWSEDSTSYPSSAPPPAPPSTAVPLRLSVEQPRSYAGVPARMTVDELRAVWGRVGVHVAEAAGALLERSKNKLVGNGSYEGFVAEALAGVPNALASYGPGEYGFLVYAQTAAQVHTRLADIMPGDVVVLEGARLKGHKGLHSYSMSAGESAPCMGVVSEFDPKKLKLRALQANRRVGQATVESVSYRLEDLKSGTIKVYRVLEA
ncbi:hypothetical protein EDB84DRAFT_1485222 [Lactarius hengduanensis]|nr:hypothetical protein EDB84DRAFT_1485222 [Lactarius hengduanensis]